MQLLPGSVTPFGILNDSERRVQFFIDREFEAEPGIAGIHPNDNTATVWIRTEDLIKLVRGHGNPVHVVDL